MSGSQVAAGCLVVLAVAHSVLGERSLLVPLFKASWSLPVPRAAAETTFRFAWHLTSLAWLALAAVLLGVELLPAVAAMLLLSAAVVVVVLPGHLAWPVFLLGGLGCLHADGLLGDGVLRAGAVATAMVLVAAAVLHVYWAVGGRWLFDRVTPTGGGSTFAPGPGLTLAVAVALAGLGGLVLAVAADVGPGALRWLVVAGVVVLTLRAVGDTKVAGFTKTVRGTPFADADDRYFTPLVVLLALGSTGAFLG